MNIDFNKWWDEDDLTTQGNPFTDGTPAYWAWEGWCAGVKAEREACERVAGIALLGAEMDLAKRVLRAIRARNNT